MGLDARWQDVCYRARVEHQWQLSLCAAGDGGVLPANGRLVEVLLFVPGLCERVQVSRDEQMGYTDYFRSEAAQRSGLGVGVIVAGVMPESQNGQMHLRPALITRVVGVGPCSGKQFEIAHRYDDGPDGIVLYGPVSRDGDMSQTWTIEFGMEGVLVGPWPLTIPLGKGSGGGVRTV